MDRNELVRRLVLNAISDDYENVDQVILRYVAEIGAKCGLTIEAPKHLSNDVWWPFDDERNLKPDSDLDSA